jgi:glycosyltransferase involved in cell wall biosynthesis
MMYPGVRFDRTTRHGRWMDPAARPGLASIIIPTFNRAALLDEALASAHAQTYRPIEILVVDDGSADDTPAVLTRWQEKLRTDPSISLRPIRQTNSGVSSALNHGLIESAGQFIQFLDSDDILFPEKLRLQIACLQRHPEAGLAFSQTVDLVPGKIEDPPSLDAAKLVPSAGYYLQNDILRIQAVYRRQTCLAAGPWSEEINLSEDREFSFRTLLTCDKIVHLPGKLAAVRAHAAGRLMDTYYRPEAFRTRLRALNMMADVARSENRLTNPSLVATLAQRFTGLATDALQYGQSEIVTAAVRACKALPISPSRRARLTVYQLFNAFPPGVYLKLASLWQSIRRRLARGQRAQQKTE